MLGSPTQQTDASMLYAVICYNEEAEIQKWTPAQDADCMARLTEVNDDLDRQGRLGPVLRLDFTGTATTLRKTSGDPVVLDGPFAETKEQLLGLYVIEADSMDQAQDAARDLARANPGTGAYEIRPIRYLRPASPAWTAA